MIRIERMWMGQTAAVVATGPSLTTTQVRQLEGKARTIAVNDSYKIAPWADMMYAADHKWWRHHAFCHSFTGERWTQNRGPTGWVDEAGSNGLEIIQCKHSLEVSTDPHFVSSGWNSGFQAMNIAVHLGAKRILLLGVDLHTGGGAHFFGEHPPGLQRSSPWATFRKAFTVSAPVLAGMRVEVINCSPTSALTCYPYMEVGVALR